MLVNSFGGLRVEFMFKIRLQYRTKSCDIAEVYFQIYGKSAIKHYVNTYFAAKLCPYVDVAFYVLISVFVFIYIYISVFIFVIISVCD